MTNHENETNELLQPEATELERLIYRAMLERGWILPRTVEEVEIVEDESDESMDVSDLPDAETLLKRVAAAPSFQTQAQAQGETSKVKKSDTSKAANPQSVLVFLRHQTKQRPSEIAAALQVTVPFLSDLGPQTPPAWQRKMVLEIKHKLSQVSAEGLQQAFETPRELSLAAFREAAYEHQELTPEQILERSGMSDEAKAIWRALLEEE